MKLIFATRPSTLARWQTSWVMGKLIEAWPGLETEEKIITTEGDRNIRQPLPEIGGKGLFTAELEQELIGGKVHAAVHSLKDLPVDNPPGLIVGAVPTRADVRDVLVSAHGYTLETLPEGATVGTSSLRRAAQLLAYRHDLQPQPLRGNVETRLRKAQEGQMDAIVLAGAGLERLGLNKHVTQHLPLEVMLPAPGQGALGVQCREGDEETLRLLSAIEDNPTQLAVNAERSFLQGLGGGCAVPVAAYAYIEGKDIQLTGVVASIDGKGVIRVHGIGSDPISLGHELAQEALRQGAGDILSEIKAEGSK